MNTNKRIQAEIEARIKRAREKLPELSPILSPILEYYDGQSTAGLAHEMLDSLSGSLSASEDGEEMQAVCFEWYYDGREAPFAMGYTFNSLKKLPDFSSIPIGSNTGEAREDFNGGMKLGNMIGTEVGGFDVGNACFPVYDCDTAELGGDEESDARDELVNLFTLRMFYCLHLVFNHLAATGVMNNAKLKLPAYFFANNHDWDPFLIFVYDGNEKYTLLTEKGPTRVEPLQSWFDEIKLNEQKKEEREEFLFKVLRSSAEDLEKNLVSMPILFDKDGATMEFTRKELERFGWSQLSDPEKYKKISFDAFVHYFRFAISCENPDIYKLQTPITCLFIRDPEQAFQFIAAYIGDKPSKKDAILDCARNCVRWTSEGFVDNRSPNPTFALQSAPDAIESMKRLQEL